MRKLLILPLIMLSLNACQNTEELQAKSISNYMKISEMCPSGYEVCSYQAVNGNPVYFCVNNDKINECVANALYGEKIGEFEDWDTSDITSIQKTCKSNNVIYF